MPGECVPQSLLKQQPTFDAKQARKTPKRRRLSWGVWGGRQAEVEYAGADSSTGRRIAKRLCIPVTLGSSVICRNFSVAARCKISLPTWRHFSGIGALGPPIRGPVDARYGSPPGCCLGRPTQMQIEPFWSALSCTHCPDERIVNFLEDYALAEIVASQ